MAKKIKAAASKKAGAPKKTTKPAKTSKKSVGKGDKGAKAAGTGAGS